jgi:glutamate dehydrogenase
MLASGSSERTAARATIEEAGAALVRRRVGIPAGFIEQLYGRVVPEDVARYGPDDLATLAARAYDFMAERKPGAPKIRCETIKLEHSADRNSVTVVEIVNDDMPFLVDSAMGEITERRLDVRLVAHPMFGVRRSGSKLIGIDAPDAANVRESFIHIHLSPIGNRARRGTPRGAGLAPDA